MNIVSQDDADQILELGLHLCMNGENAPGGTETWRQFGAHAELYLRRRTCMKRGFHTPNSPMCDYCKRMAEVMK